MKIFEHDFTLGGFSGLPLNIVGIFVQVQMHAWYIILFYCHCHYIIKRLHENPKSLLYWGGGDIEGLPEWQRFSAPRLFGRVSWVYQIPLACE